MSQGKGTSRAPRVAIVGAGVSGIAMAVALKRQGIADFHLYEARNQVGGTWAGNHYPGCGVDIHSSLYQYSFRLQNWTRTHATQGELLDYLKEVVHEFGITSHLLLNTTVEEVCWDDTTHMYHLLTSAGHRADYDIVVSALGFLDDPRLPSWPGLDRFEGVAFHTARWRDDVDLTGKTVAVVGVGSSSAQVVPALQPVVARLLVFQRDASWVLPKNERAYSPGELESSNRRIHLRWRRWLLAIRYEWMYLTGPPFVEKSRRNQRFERMARDYINKTFEARPELRDALTPGYVYQGKRRVLSDDFYPALLKDNVKLVPRPVVRVTQHGVVDDSGTEHPVDALIMATGFKASDYLSKLTVYGRYGREIHEVWKEGAFALVGMTVPGFPNFYMLYGPNTNGAGAFSVPDLAERQAKWILRDIKKRVRSGYTAIDTKPVVTAWYNTWLQKRLRRTAWASADNYMKAANGKIVTQFLGTITLNRALLFILRPVGTYGKRLSNYGLSPDAPSSLSPTDTRSGAADHF